MTLDLDTFLVALYTTVDDLYQEHCAPRKPRRPGRRPSLSDSEVLTLTLCAQFIGKPESWLVRHAREHWRAYFPNLLSQSATNRRARDLAGVLRSLVHLLAARLGAFSAPYQVLDGLPVELMRRCRGHRHRLFSDEADIGKGGSDKDYYYGCKMLLAVTDVGVITGFTVGPASTEERWLAEHFLCRRQDRTASPRGPEDFPPSHRKGGGRVGPTGPIWPRDGAGESSSPLYIADRGFSGENWVGYWASEYHALVLTPDAYSGEHAKSMKTQHARLRHVIETLNEHLEHAFHLPFPGARTFWGLYTRVAATLAAFNIGVCLARIFGHPDFGFATLFSC
jgi:hypothetical protein